MATLDHFIPKSKGGSDAIDNLVMACRECNARKGDGLPFVPIGWDVENDTKSGV